MKYTLTGNFQYDLSIFGFKRILDFFNEEYGTDENYYIEIEKDPGQILEIVLKKFVYDRGINYFQNKVIDDIFKTNDKDLQKIFEKYKKDFLKDNNIIIKNFNFEKIAKENNINEVINKSTVTIHKNLNNKLKQFLDKNKIELEYDVDQIKNLIWAKSVWLLNNVLLNFQADAKVKGREALDKAIFKLTNLDTLTEHACTFCNKHEGRPIRRDLFFFAPAQLNAFWFNESSVFICPYCLAINFAITQSLIFFKNSKKNAITVYKSNLKEIDQAYTSLVKYELEDFNSITRGILDYHEYNKTKLKKQASELQLIEFYIEGQNPDLNFYILTNKGISNLSKVKDNLKKLYEAKGKRLWGAVKDKSGYRYISISKELLFNFSYNQKLINIVNKYINYSLKAEMLRQKIKEGHLKENKAVIIGFYPTDLMEIINMHYLIEGGLNMNELRYFKDFGRSIRTGIMKVLVGEKNENESWYQAVVRLKKENTFKNKSIALSSQFLNSSKSSFEIFMDTLTRVIIGYKGYFNTEYLACITRENYREIGSIIALSIMTVPPKGEDIKDEINSDNTDENKNNVPKREEI